jgi:hypothetical protein
MQPATAEPRRASIALLGFAAPVALAFALAWGRLPAEDPAGYFAFADTRALGALPNAWNVLTNLPFVAVAWGLWRTYGRDPEPAFRRAGAWLAAGMLLTAAGSAWFHRAPSPETLFWDRLPMALAFSGVALLLVADRFSSSLALALSWPLPLAAMGTVAWWRLGGGLRPYLALQFGSMAWTLLVVAGRRPRRLSDATIAGVLAAYALAKGLEAGDGAIYAALGGTVSGHALKHLCAAAALALLTRPPAPPAR